MTWHGRRTDGPYAARVHTHTHTHTHTHARSHGTSRGLVVDEAFWASAASGALEGTATGSAREILRLMAIEGGANAQPSNATATALVRTLARGGRSDTGSDTVPAVAVHRQACSYVCVCVCMDGSLLTGGRRPWRCSRSRPTRA
jgi:hypothetical protein